MSFRAAESRFLSLSPAKTPKPTNASTATPAPTPMPAATPELSPDSFSSVGLDEAVGSAVALAFVPSVSTAALVVEEVGESNEVTRVEEVDDADDSGVGGVARVVEGSSFLDWDSEAVVEEVEDVVEVVVSLSVEVEEELVDDFGVLVPALDPLTEVNPTKTLVVTG
jgi:NTP pyrophosphatase (non-canonical NTP hydrolase)